MQVFRVFLGPKIVLRTKIDEFRSLLLHLDAFYRYVASNF